MSMALLLQHRKDAALRSIESEGNGATGQLIGDSDTLATPQFKIFIVSVHNSL
jgi:hypothetical protein